MSITPVTSTDFRRDGCHWMYYEKDKQDSYVAVLNRTEFL